MQWETNRLQLGSATSVNFGQKVVVPLLRNGDLIHRTQLLFTLPPIHRDLSDRMVSEYFESIVRGLKKRPPSTSVTDFVGQAVRDARNTAVVLDVLYPCDGDPKRFERFAEYAVVALQKHADVNDWRLRSAVRNHIACFYALDAAKRCSGLILRTLLSSVPVNGKTACSFVLLSHDDSNVSACRHRSWTTVGQLARAQTVPGHHQCESHSPNNNSNPVAIRCVCRTHARFCAHVAASLKPNIPSVVVWHVVSTYL
jgi:hypothetical protein